MRLTTPVNYRIFDIIDASLNKFQELKKLTFEPSFFIKHTLSAYWESSISARLTNDFGDFDQLYYGFILNNYRNIQRYDSPLPQHFRQSYTTGLAYRDAPKSIFASGSYSYSNSKNNLLYSNEIGENGAVLLESTLQDNYSNNHNLNLEGSKYLNDLNTTLNLTSNLRYSSREQLLNSNLADVKNRALSLGAGLESEITDWLSASYSADFSFLETKLENRNFQEIKTQQHELGLFFYLNEQQYFSLDSEYYFNNISKENRNNYFLNLSYQYTFTKPKVDLEAKWNNILDTNEFVRVSNSTYSYIEHTYQLRPSQLLVSLKFSF